MKNFIFIFIFTLILNVKACATYSIDYNKKQDINIENCNCIDEAIQYKHYVSNIQKGRAILYNALDLSDEQIEYRENIIAENTQIFDNYFKELLRECYRYKALKSANVNYFKLNNQKKIIEKIKKRINCLLQKESDDFRKCLTKYQKTKYKIIKNIEKYENKKIKHQKDYFKSNPRLRYFGNPQKDCYASNNHK